jgi:membrane-associated phospholipid phosphatase
MGAVVTAAFAIGLGMVILRLHYLSDVIAAIPLGLAVAGLVALTMDAITARGISRDNFGGFSSTPQPASLS